MSTFSKTSAARLAECHEDLQTVMSVAISQVGMGLDFKIMCGYRGEAEQNAAFEAGNSKVKFPNSKHNKTPSMAVDIVPTDTEYTDARAMERLGYYVKGISDALFVEGRTAHRVRWGGDWDGDFSRTDQSFDDLPHFELMEEA